jgi:serine/threonine protein kinase
MSASTSSDQFDAAQTTRLWQAVSDCVENFVNAWESADQPPEIAAFAAGRDPGLRRLALVELIKVDLEYRADRSLPVKQVEAYLAEFPEIAEEGLPLDLVYEEYHIRKRSGEEVQSEEYCRRFPDHAEELRRMLGLEAPNVTTNLFRGEAAAAAIEINERIDDFDILAKLGKGAFATVFLARQRSMQRVVALKVSADRGIEAQTLAQLDHPHIVRVYDQRHVVDRGLRLLYMQYVPGGTLQAVVELVRQCPQGERTGQLLLRAVDRALDDGGQSPPSDSMVRRRIGRASWGETVCWIGARLASALEYAHQHGVLHRDIKPANVLVAADGTPKLVDFNIACCSKIEGAGPAAYFGGSLAYMSPEQLEACNPAHERTPEEIDARSEVYSLGVLLWELVCGQRPFADEPVGGGWPQLLSSMVTRRRQGVSPQALAQLPTDLPRGLREVLLKCLAPEPEDRFHTAGELARQLELCLRPGAQRLMLPSGRSWRAWARRRPLLTLALGGVLPSAALSALNIPYNVRSLIDRLVERLSVGASAAEAQRIRDLFWNVQIPAINGSLYPSALATGILLCWPVLRSLRRDDAPRAEVRRKSLWVGDYIFWVTLLAWTLSGVIYPAWLEMETRSRLQSSFYFHFFASQFLFGLLSGTLAFFLDTFITVRALYPSLLKRSEPDERDVQWLGRLSNRVWRFFGVSVAVPFLAVAVLAGTAWLFGGSEQTTAFAVTGLLGLLGFFFAFGMSRAIQADIGALATTLAPSGEVLPGETQTFDLLTASTRVS